MNVKLTGLKKIRILNSDEVFGIMQKVLHRENKIDREKDQERGKKDKGSCRQSCLKQKSL